MESEVEQELKRKIAAIADDRGPIKFLLVGRTGVGKSSTINSLLGTELAPVGKFNPTTMDITSYSYTHDDIDYQIYDTPGLCDDLPEQGNNDKYLKKISDTVKKIDLLWFVTELSATRLSGAEREGIKLITKAMGPKIWQHAIIVFTRADFSDEESFNLDLKERTRIIHSEIRKNAPRLKSDIPAIAISNSSSLLPDGTHWLGELFTKIFEQINERVAIKFLISMRNDIGIGEKHETSGKKHIEPPRIPLSKGQQQRIRINALDRLKNAAAGTAAGVAVGKYFGKPGVIAGAIIGFLCGLFSD
ncbi:GTPase [Shewanella acanthi]|uniref:GTPase n=1 Tax=Shewanella acanthi TaxID=2864212 RepID=UPI001C65F7EE|nr:GTPase [Shewanella acanthi]QYJ77925.1 50S ribosome-binding GTPase [Shewanella acanthi]